MQFLKLENWVLEAFGETIPQNEKQGLLSFQPNSYCLILLCFSRILTKKAFAFCFPVL